MGYLGRIRLYLLPLLILVFLTSLVFAAETPARKAVVSVVEGEVICFDYPEGYPVDIGEIKIGHFKERVNDYSGRVEIEGRIELCYIPYDLRYQITERLQPCMYVLVQQNYRRQYKTEWDIISVGQMVDAEWRYLKGEQERLTAEEALALLKLADELKGYIVTEEGIFIERTREEMTNDVLEEAGVSMEEVPPPVEEVPPEAPPPPPSPPSLPRSQVLPPEEEVDAEEEEEFPEVILAPLTIATSSPLPDGAEGTAYSVTFHANGGTRPYTWSLVSGSLPSGLSLSIGGVISGTPAASSRATYTFTVKVTDNNSITATKDFSLKIGYYRTAIDEYVWITNDNDGNVARINRSDPSSITYISVGAGTWPRHIAVDDNYVWVSNWNGDTVTRIAKSDSSTTSTSVGNAPYGVAVDETYVWVANTNDNNVTRINKSNITQTTTIGVGTTPYGVAVDDTYVWVANVNSNNVTRIDKSDSSTTTITVGQLPCGVAVDSNYVWVTNYKDDTVTRIDKSDITSKTTINVGDGPFGVTVDDTYVWVANVLEDSVTRITKSDIASKTTINVGDSPRGIAVDNTYVWVANQSANTVTRITKSDSSTTTINVGNAPFNVGDATGYSFDQFFTGTLVDPNITGRVYDSETGENVDGVIVSIYQEGSTTALASSTDNPYSFNVDDGSYYLRVEKEGYTFPSNTVNGITAGDHGEVFYATGTSMTIDIPLDPGYPIEITKTANKRKVVVGDIVTYNIKIKNNSMWALDNIAIIDEITNGFKYVSESTYLDSTQQIDPTISARTATFNVGSVSGYSVVNLSYQIRVGTGIADGEYKTTAVAWDTYRDWQMSNRSSCKVEVVADALFTMGTIIGKVFYDLNGNGVQDSGLSTQDSEKGIGGVRIVTEYGVVVETDRDGKYHIPAVPPGTHLLKVDVSSVILNKVKDLDLSTRSFANAQDDSFQFTTENPYLVKITEGLLAKVNFGVALSDEQEQDPRSLMLDPSKSREGLASSIQDLESKFFMVALAEGIVRNLSTSGNVDMVEQDDRFDEGIRVDGKLALYLKGKIKGKYLVTASFDTDRRPSRRGRMYELRKLFTNLDPDKYYPVYGDASKISYEAADTQDELYLLVEWDKSHIKWGAFHTEIPVYNRTMQGASIVYESIKQTKFGDPYTKITAFYARAYQVAAHDEFIGTGGSLYYLRHIPVIEGSEKVSVELRDQVNKETIAAAILIEERDYEIDYDTGRILLKKPLSSVNYNYNASIISNDILSGARAYLVVDYEYEATSSLRREAYGIKASQQIGNHIRLGGTYIEEEKSNQYYRLMGGDGTIKLNEDTEVTAEYLRSEETQLSGSHSITGGLDFSVKSATADDDKSGSAVIIKGKTRVFGNTDINASYTRQDKHFSATNTISTQGASIYTGSILSRLKDNFILGIKHTTQIVNDAVLATDLIGSNKVHTTTGLLDYKPGRWDIRLEYQHQNTEDPFVDFTYAGSRQLMDHDLIGGRIGYKLNDKIHPYMGGQVTVQNQVNNQGYIGAEINIWKDTNIRVKETVGNLGNSTLLGLTSQVTPDTEIYTNIEVGNNAQLGDKYTRSTYGQRTQLSPTSRVYVEHDYSSWQENLMRGNILGYEAELGESLALGIHYERAQIEKEPTAISRDCGSITLSYLDVDKLHLFSKIEVREDRGSNTKLQWLTQNKALWYLTQDVSLAGRANWSRTENQTTEETEAQFHEMGIGLAYRPVRFDRLNLLAKYSYITNDRPESQNDFSQTQEDIKHIYAVEGAFDICRYLQLIGKFAMRDLAEKVGPRDWTDSETYLYIGRLNFHVTHKWDLAAEYRSLANRQIEDNRSGWLLEVDRELGKYIRLGVGYNFTDYDDDLGNDDYDASGWFVRVNGKY